MRDSALRASEVFSQARQRILLGCQKMHTEHAAKGLLASGTTAKRAIGIFHEEMSGALKQVLNEIAKVVKHRGKTWASALEGIAQALEVELATAPETLDSSFHLAGASQGSAQTAVQNLISEAGLDLRRQLAEFRDGWTAPPPEKWSQRQPMAYAILLMLLGYVTGMVIQVVAAPFATDLFQQPRAELKASLDATNMAGMSVSVTNSGELAGSYAATEITAKSGAQIAKTYMVPTDAPMRSIMIPAKSSKLIELEPFSSTGWFWVRSNDECALEHTFVDNDGGYFSKRGTVHCDEISEYHNLILVLSHLRRDAKKVPQSPSAPKRPQ